MSTSDATNQERAPITQSARSRKSLLAVILIACALQTMSCTVLWTREFTPAPTVNGNSSIIIGGWELEPDIYAYRKLAGDTVAPSRDTFNLRIKATYRHSKKADVVTDLSIGEVRMIIGDQGDTITMAPRIATYLSTPQDDFIGKYFYVTGPGEDGTLRLPEEVRGVQLEFDATIRPGELMVAGDSYPRHDSVAAFGSSGQRYPVSVSVYRNEERSWGAGFRGM